MNGLLDKIVIKSCNKLNLETLRELYITLVSCNLYFKNHHLFPSERMADGYAFSTIAQIYNILGSAYFKDYKDFKELIYYELKKEYIKIKDKIITPYNRFTQILSSYGYEITCIDINKIDVYNRVLSGLEEDINNIDMVINTKILTKQV